LNVFGSTFSFSFWWLLFFFCEGRVVVSLFFYLSLQ